MNLNSECPNCTSKDRNILSDCIHCNCCQYKDSKTIKIAERYFELGFLKRNLKKTRMRVYNDIQYCKELSYDSAISSEYLRRSLMELEWKVYNHVSIIHMLEDVIQKTNNIFNFKTDIGFRKTEVPELIGIRNCIHHNGPIKLNIGDIKKDNTTIDKIIFYDLDILKRDKYWNRGSYEDFFFRVDEDEDIGVIIEKAIRCGDEIDTIIEKCRSEIINSYQRNLIEKIINKNYM